MGLWLTWVQSRDEHDCTRADLHSSSDRAQSPSFSSSSSSSPLRHSQLLSLPYDVRYIILKKLLLSREPICDLIPDGFCHKIKPGQLEKDHICVSAQAKQRQEFHLPAIDSTIMRVCRQLYNEGLPILFQNRFQFTSIEAIEHFQDSCTYAFLRPRIRHVELVSSIDAFDTPMWHRLAPIATRLQVSQQHGGLRDDIQPFLAAWAGAEAARQEALGPVRHLDTLTIIFRNWSWNWRGVSGCGRGSGGSGTTRKAWRPKFPDTLSCRAQQLLLESMCAMLKQGFPSKAAACRICGLVTASSSEDDEHDDDSITADSSCSRSSNGDGDGEVVLRIKYADPAEKLVLLKNQARGEEGARSAALTLTQQQYADEEIYAASWDAFEERVRTDLLAHLHGGHTAE